MRYFGSKVTAVDYIYNLISRKFKSGTFCDPFGGIGTVGSYMRSHGFDVWSGDILTFAHYFQIARLKYPNDADFSNILKTLNLRNTEELNDYLNNIRPFSGWFVSEYSEKRPYFTTQNAMKIEACWRTINEWKNNKLINNDEMAMLLAGLINCMDKVANTAGTYYAFLKTWHRKALCDFNYKVITPPINGGNGICLHESAETVVLNRHFDVLYLDPPYNGRSYAHYYHLPETIAKRISPSIHGKSGIPNNKMQISSFNRKTEATNSLEKIINNSNFNLLIFHYSSNGLIKNKNIYDILSSKGDVKTYDIQCKGYSTTKRKSTPTHCIYTVQNG